MFTVDMVVVWLGTAPNTKHGSHFMPLEPQVFFLRATHRVNLINSCHIKQIHVALLKY